MYTYIQNSRISDMQTQLAHVHSGIVNDNKAYASVRLQALLEITKHVLLEIGEPSVSWST